MIRPSRNDLANYCKTMVLLVCKEHQTREKPALTKQQRTRIEKHYFRAVSRVLDAWENMRCARCGRWVRDVPGSSPAIFLPSGHIDEPYGYALCGVCAIDPDQLAVFLDVEQALRAVMTNPDLSHMKIGPTLEVIDGGKDGL